MTLSRKGAKSGTHSRNLRSTGTKVEECVQGISELHAALEKQTRSTHSRARRSTHLCIAEALEQQTATAEVLQAISSSPAELGTIFQAMLEKAVRLCEARLGVLYRYESGFFHPAALAGAPPALADFIWQRGSFAPSVGAALDRLLQTKTGGPYPRPGKAAIPGPLGRPLWARDLISTFQCSRMMNWSASSQSGARRCGRSPTSRLSWSRISQTRPS